MAWLGFVVVARRKNWEALLSARCLKGKGIRAPTVRDYEPDPSLPCRSVRLPSPGELGDQ